MILKISQAGDPVLRKQARELSVEEIQSAAVQQLIELMRETMRDTPGVGLAAPQVGESLALAVIEDRDEYLGGLTRDQLKERERRAVPFHVIVNPKLTAVAGTAQMTFFEGCLSVSGFVAAVPRAREVRVEALDHRGKPISIEAKGWYARILQHEIDHLSGTLYIDHMLPRTFMGNAGFSRHWAQKSTNDVLADLER
jgi:peptide deformylase